jgi:hypothetical protein
MKKAVRLSLVSVALAGVLLVLAPPAQAQVRVEGRFRLPHGSISVGVGDPYSYGIYGSPAFPIGSYVPYGYRVIRQPRLGYGFYHRSRWIPVRPYGRRYIVIERPIVVVDRGYDDRYRGDGYYRNNRPPCQPDGAYCGDPYYDFNREYWDRSYHPYDR